MGNIIDYKVEIGVSISDLEARVSTEISKGWQPFGGLCQIEKKESFLFSQALVKYK